jgi:hypothetical protein
MKPERIANSIERLMLIPLLSLGLLLSVSAAQAADVEHRLGQDVPLAVGIGIEISHGDYDVDADATVTTAPVVVAVNPSENIDLTFELPLVHLRSRSDSGVVVTGSGGGGGMGRGPGGNGTMAPAAPPVPSATTNETSSETVTESGLGDISLLAGWTLLHDSDQTPRVRPTLYLKVPSGDDDRGLGTGTFEGGPGISVSKWFGDWQLFADGAYILQDSTSDYRGEDYFSYSAGGGVQATDRLFVSLYADGSSARVEDGDAPVEGWLKLNFLQSRRLSWEAYVLAGFTDASPDTGGGLLVMYQF